MFVSKSIFRMDLFFDKIPVCIRTQLNGTSLAVSADELVLGASSVATQVVQMNDQIHFLTGSRWSGGSLEH